jgi:tetratricopeptide (TPR) repeat protein
MSELAQFQPPGYVASTLRGADNDANGEFREAMKYYIRGEYASSIPILIAASQLDPKAANISFFLGICYLLTGHTDAGIQALRKTLALGDSPYLEEAHFYLAKALIRDGDLNGARSQLRETIQLRGDVEQKAQRLLRQLQVAGNSQH